MRSQIVSQGRGESGEPLLTIAGRNVGLRKAFRVLTFMAAWDQARRSMMKAPITLQEYSDWWKLSERTMYREQALFREAFPGEVSPDRLLDLAVTQWDDRRGVNGLGAIRVDF